MTGKSIRAANGDNSQRRSRVPILCYQALNYLVDRSIAAAGEDHIGAAVRRFSRLGRG
jgi:hypothetical protein